MQDLDTVTCSIFEIYFYDNLFNPDKSSKIQNKTKLNKKTIEILLNGLLVLNDQQQNKKNNKQARWRTGYNSDVNLPVSEPAIIYLLDIVDFGQVTSNGMK